MPDGVNHVQQDRIDIADGCPPVFAVVFSPVVRLNAIRVEQRPDSNAESHAMLPKIGRIFVGVTIKVHTSNYNYKCTYSKRAETKPAGAATALARLRTCLPNMLFASALVSPEQQHEAQLFFPWKGSSSKLHAVSQQQAVRVSTMGAFLAPSGGLGFHSSLS